MTTINAATMTGYVTHITYPSTIMYSATSKPTKKEIVQRLLESRFISYEEMQTLLEEPPPTTQYIPPYVPDVPQWVQPLITPYYDSNNT